MSFQPTLRRNQLIAPFGVGAIHILKGSRAVVTAGLDFWFRNATPQQLQLVKIREPRLEKRLGVSYFRLPPGPETELKDLQKLEVPLFRFPTWFVCPRCHRMEQRTLCTDGDAKCSQQGCNSEIMRQISFAAVCDHGHLQDFPWKEWIRREETPDCSGQNCPIYYTAGGSGSLDDISVGCKQCGKRRNLAGIMTAKPANIESSDSIEKRGSSTLTSILLAKDSNNSPGGSCSEFLCQSGRVWLGDPGVGPGANCKRPLRAILINATNVHYAQVVSALWIPQSNSDSDSNSLKVLLDRPEIRNQVKVLQTFNLPPEQIAENILQTHVALLTGKTKQEITEALRDGNTVQDLSWQDGLTSEEIIRLPEYKQLKTDRLPLTTEEPLEIRTVKSELLPKAILGISLIDKLRETRVFRGFNRLVPEHIEGAPQSNSHLWNNAPTVDADKWLPCSVVFGEGIFIHLDENILSKWETQKKLVSYLQPIQMREDAAARRMGRPPRQVRPRFLLLHTLAHLLIRRLVFECGYGSTSLRERLYVSENKSAKMAGILIYTASGDCEGSMGGLVRMGEPEHFSRVFQAAIYDATWCSADPVCTESGENGGQGIDGLNIAACHCCALLPETSCEFFNCFLDRTMVNEFFNIFNLNEI